MNPDSTNLNPRILSEEFFCKGADELAVNLLGKVLVRKIDGAESRYLIAETECYMGVSDTACHAARGKTLRTSTLWERGGTLYVHLIYGLYYMLNIVAGLKGDPMGVLIRGAKEIQCQSNLFCQESKANIQTKTYGAKQIQGPGRLTRQLKIGADFNREDLLASDRIWIEDTGLNPEHISTPRIGINYAAKQDIEKLWRFTSYKYL